jgi:hypothetical protein
VISESELWNNRKCALPPSSHELEYKSIGKEQCAATGHIKQNVILELISNVSLYFLNVVTR